MGGLTTKFQVTATALPVLGRSLFERPAVVLDPLHTGREYAFLLTTLALTGTVGIKPRDLALARTLLTPRLFHERVRLAFGAEARTISNAPDTVADVRLDKAYYSRRDDAASFRLPYFAHPVFYRTGLFLEVGRLRDSGKSRGVFFSGTAGAEAYGRPLPFPILRRDQIFESLRRRFAGRIGASLQGKEDLILLTTDDPSDVLGKHALTPRDYLVELSRSRFFICPPGCKMPHSHNIVEAMSVGAIPITNYAAYMAPPLQDGVDCLSFWDEETLVLTIERACAMCPPQVAVMRDAVLRYYDDNLAPGAVGRALRTRLGSIDRLIVNDESGA